MSLPIGRRLIRIDAYDDGLDAWSTARVAPPDALRGLIHGYADYAERTGGFTTRRELPHADGVFIVNLGDPIVITGGDGCAIRLGAGEAFVAGVHLRPALSGSFGAQAGVHIFLPLESLRRLLGVPLHQLVDQVVPLDAILGADARALCDPLRDANDRDRRIALLDAALTRRFAESEPLAARQTRAWPCSAGARTSTSRRSPTTSAGAASTWPSGPRMPSASGRAAIAACCGSSG